MKRIINVIVSLLILSLLPFSAVSCTSDSKSAQKNTEIADTKKFEQVQKELNDYLDKYYKDTFSGSILIVSEGKILASKGYGMADYENNIPNTPETSFNIASLTKQFTAMGIMILSDKGLLDVNDKIGKYIEGIDHGNEITIHQLLTQTSGIDNNIYEQDMFKNAQGGNVVEIIEKLKGQKFELGNKPGTIFSYCNVNYYLLGYIIEKLSGESYESFISKNIFKPLGMKNSGYYHSNMADKNHAVGYSQILQPPVRANMAGMEYAYSAGGLYSSAEDFYKWDQALYTDKLVKKETLNKIFGKYPDGYGYGWYISDDKGGIVAQHDGVINGGNSHIIRYTNKKRLIVIFTNLEGGLPGFFDQHMEKFFSELD